MLSVVATKIRSARERASNRTTVGRVYRGYLLCAPKVGRGMVLFRDVNGKRMVTTPVRRVLRTGDTRVVYIETENSVYRLYVGEASETFDASAAASGCFG